MTLAESYPQRLCDHSLLPLWSYGAPSSRLPCGVAHLATLLSPNLSTRPASHGPGIDLSLRDFEPPSLRLSRPNFPGTAVLAVKLLIPIPELGTIRIVIRMLRHIGADGIVRNS